MILCSNPYHLNFSSLISKLWHVSFTQAIFESFFLLCDPTSWSFCFKIYTVIQIWYIITYWWNFNFILSKLQSICTSCTQAIFETFFQLFETLSLEPLTWKSIPTWFLQNNQIPVKFQLHYLYHNFSLYRVQKMLIIGDFCPLLRQPFEEFFSKRRFYK